MKGLNKIALLAAITAASSAQAELVAMDDSALSATTGQAGITIDINAAEVSIGEIAYQDEGFLAIQDLVLTGSTDAFGSGQGDGILNNIRMTVDVAGAGETAGRRDDPSGSHEFELANDYVGFAASIIGEQVGNAVVDQSGLISDGDLVITFRSINLVGGIQTVDYGLQIGSVKLGDSNQEIGAITGTELISDLNLAGFLGPVDIIVHNGDEGVNISAYFNSEGSLNLPFLNVSTDLKIHNVRGANRTWILTESEGTSLAHVQMNIKRGTQGLAFDLQNFEADIDLENITMGTSPSIGDVYITDLHMTAQTE
ncbi:MAG: DUF6160 family protein, partial [Pseudomonadales bacterium]|nr:DUF6160 family protein [Pseudomonadales bacterium]